MKFDRLIKSLLMEAPQGDLGFDPSLTHEPPRIKAGVRKAIKASSKDLVGAARSKAREIVNPITGEIDLEANELDAPRAAITSNFEKLIYGEVESGEELVRILSIISRELRTLKDFNIPSDAKAIKIIREETEGETEEEPEGSGEFEERMISLSAVAQETLAKFADLKANSDIESIRALDTEALPLRDYLKALKSIAGEKVGKKTQDLGSWNILALDAERSNENHWEIFVRNPKRDEQGEVVAGKLRQTYGPKDTRSKWLQDAVGRLVKFVNGVPKYGQTCGTAELWGEKYNNPGRRVTLGELFNNIGYYTIWNVIYAKYRTDAEYYELPDGSKIDLKKLTISYYELSDEREIVYGRDVQVATTAPRQRILPRQPIESEE